MSAAYLFVFRFQSALPRGERPACHFVSVNIVVFQSALPRGERPVGHCCPCCHLYFNPRSREGSDASPANTSPPPELFQSALPRGERHDSLIASVTHQSISIRAPARGATTIYSQIFTTRRISIRAPARGATRQGCCEVRQA